MKVCLIPTIPLGLSTTEPYLPLGILSLVSVLRETRVCQVEIVDLNLEILRGDLRVDGSFYAEACKLLRNTKADVYGFSTMCDSYIHTINIAQLLKQQSPSSRIIFGGPQSTATDIATLKHFQFVDMVVRGEAEHVLVGLIEKIKRKEELHNVPSLTFRNAEGDIVRHSDTKPIENLDELPIPAYEDYGAILSNYTSRKPRNSIHRYVPIDSGRGCPYNCAFCYSPSFWQRKHRSKSIERLVDEIGLLKSNFGVRTFYFPEDLFTVSRKRLLAFCKALIELDYDVEWTCYARADSVDDEMLDRMYEAGCRHIYYGIESGAESIQKFIGKSIDLARARDTVEKTIQHGIKATTSFIVGFPGESHEDFKKTIDAIFDFIALGSVGNIHLLGVIAGTPIHRMHKDDLVLGDIQSDHYVAHYLIDRKNIELIRSYPDVFSFFYYLPSTNVKSNFIKNFRLELLAATFITSIRVIRKHIEMSREFFNMLEEWCTKNNRNQNYEWLRDEGTCISDVSLFLRELASVIGQPYLTNIVEAEVASYLQEAQTKCPA